MIVLASSIADTFECKCHTDTEDHEAFIDWLAAEGERVYIEPVALDPRGDVQAIAADEALAAAEWDAMVREDAQATEA